MLYAASAVVIGLLFLVWSADRFIDGAAATAGHFGMPPLLVGMVIVGFGTSAPEMVVSVLSALEGSPGIALGNAYGSNITNIALILGVTALISPIAVQKNIVRRELPVLLAVMALGIVLVWDGRLSWTDGALMLAVLAAYMLWTVLRGLKTGQVADGAEEPAVMGLKPALFWLVSGLAVLVVSSRLLVWGAVEIAKAVGVSDLVIGLTVVAVGTSLPELASSVMAARKNEHDIAIGNVVGSNLFNALGVVGLAAVLHPMDVPAEILGRDAAVMTALTVLLLLFCLGRGGAARIGRVKGGVLLAAYIAYTVYLVAVSF